MNASLSSWGISASSHTCEAGLAPFVFWVCENCQRYRWEEICLAFLSSSLIGKETWAQVGPSCSVENAILSFVKKNLEAARSSV